MALKTAVHQGQLKFILEVRHRAQAAQQGADPALGRVFNGQARKGLHHHARFVLEGLAGHFHPFLMAEQREFWGIVGHGHDDPVKDVAAAPDQAEMAVGQRVEGAGIEGCFHDAVQMQMRVWPKRRSARRLKEAGGVSATSFSISAVTKAPGASQPLSARARRAGSARFLR